MVCQHSTRRIRGSSAGILQKKSTTICISLASKGDVEVAKKKGMPIVEIGVTEI